MPHVIVVGGGIAGLTAALALAPAHRVTLITKEALGESNTAYAQGGIAAAMSRTDSVEAHIADTIAVGGGISEADAVAALCEDGPARIRELLALGVPFDRADGRAQMLSPSQTQTSTQTPAGDDLALGLEAAHSAPRIVHAGGDATGAAIQRALAAAVRPAGIDVIEFTSMVDLLAEPDPRSGVRVVRGVELISGVVGRLRVEADAVLLASGGAGRLYPFTTNPSVATGDGVAAAWRAGAVLADIEFIQFHPTTLRTPAGGFLVSEAVRGAGAVLRNDRGERFMTRVHPAAELAPRDVVARAVAAEMAAQGGSPVRLDATGLGAAELARHFPTIDAATRALGYDWAREPIPIAPAAHYWMGGVWTDAHGRTTLPGLWAAGEVASTGVHGANRLASNSLLEASVFGKRAATDIAEALSGGGPHAPVAAAAPVEHARLMLDADAVPTVARDAVRPSRADLQNEMWAAAGLTRDGARLERAASVLSGWRVDENPHADAMDLEDRNLLEIARLIVAAATARRESRGAHFRSDSPETRSEFAGHTLFVRDAQAAGIQPSAVSVAIDSGELTPANSGELTAAGASRQTAAGAGRQTDRQKEGLPC